MKKDYKIFILLSVFMLECFVTTRAQTLYLTDSRAAFSRQINMNNKFDFSKLEIFNGVYLIYFNKELKYNHIKVKIKNNKIDGYLIEYDSVGRIKTAGYYFQDSLWSFFSNPMDTTYKVGIWLYYNNKHLFRKKYSIPVSLIKEGYKDIFGLYNDGTIARETIYDTSLNILETKIFFTSGAIRSHVQLLNDSTIYFVRYNKDGTILYQVIDRPSIRIEYKSINNRPELFVYKCGNNNLTNIKSYHLTYPVRGYEAVRVYVKETEKIWNKKKSRK